MPVKHWMRLQTVLSCQPADNRDRPGRSGAAGGSAGHRSNWRQVKGSTARPHLQWELENKRRAFSRLLSRLNKLHRNIGESGAGKEAFPKSSRSLVGNAIKLVADDLRSFDCSMSGPQVVPELHEAARRHPGSATAVHAPGDARQELFHQALSLSSVVGPAPVTA